MFRVSNRSQSPVFGTFAASPWSGAARRAGAIRTALATGHRRGLLLVAVMLLLLAAEARAQTASFSYAIASLGGGGFNNPQGVAVDGNGNLYIADWGNNGVKEMPAGCASPSCVTALGGSFIHPYGVAVDGSGNVYVADWSNSGAVKEMPSGCASSSCVTVLGGGFNFPGGVAVDGSGNVYVADTDNNAVKKMRSGCASSSCVTAMGGGFSYPYGVALDGSGNVYVADNGNSAVKEMPSGCVSSSCVTSLGGGFSGTAGAAVDGGGNVYVADLFHNAVKEMPAGCASSSCVTTLVGGFTYPTGVAVDHVGNVYATDSGENVVKEIMTRGVNFFTVPVGTASAALTLTFTFNSAGSLSSTTPYQVLTQGATNLDFNAAATQGANACNGTATYTAGDACTVNVTFTPTKAGIRYGAVELLNAGGSAIATAYVFGTGTGPQVVFMPGTETTVAADLAWAAGIAVDGSGNVYISDYNQPGNGHELIYKEMPSGTAYTESTIPTNTQAAPGGIAVDGSGSLYVAYGGNLLEPNSMILKETPAAGGYVQSTIATFTPGQGISPFGIAVDGSGNVFFSSDTGVAYKESLIAGSYTLSTVVSGLPSAAGIAVDGGGSVYIAVNETNGWIAKETPSTTGYTQSKIAVGSGGVPFGVAVDGSGNVYVAYIDNNDIGKIYKLTPTSDGYIQSTIATSELNQPMGVAVDGSGNVYVGNSGVYSILKEDLADPPSLLFDTTPVGSISDDSPKTVTLENVGNAALNFINPVSGNNSSLSANFSLDSDGASACPALTASSPESGTLAAGAECLLPFSFAPSATGTLTGSLTITDNNLNAVSPGYAAQTISLSGTATASSTPVAAALISPVSHSTLPCSSATFSWSAGTSVTNYWLNIGTGTGGSAAKNLYTSGSTTATRLTVTSLPSYGQTVYATLFSYITGAWLADSPVAYIECGTPVPATMTSPTPGTQFAGTSVTFTWSAGGGLSGYWLDLGTAASGANLQNLYSSGPTSATTLTVAGLPTNGETIYATLYSESNGTWLTPPAVYIFYATGPAVLITPSPSTKLTASTTFTWTSGTGIAHFWFNLGTAASAANAKNIYSGSPTTSNSVTVSSIPQYGETLYATLYSYVAGVWQPIVYTFSAAGSPVAAALTTPTPNTKLSSSSVTFTWSGGEGVTDYWFNLGTSPVPAFAKNIYSGSPTTQTSVSISGLPTNGETIYATLYSYIAGVWQPTVYSYTASGTPSPAVLTTPTPSTTLTSSTVTFTWSAGNPATQYWFNVGTGTSGAAPKNIYSGSPTTATSVTVTGLPTNGETIYATLYSYIAGAWQPTVYTYKAQ